MTGVPGAPGLRFGSAVFLCSKPLQALNCLSIARHYGIERPLVLLVDRGFPDCEAFLAFLRSARHAWPAEFRRFPDHRQAAAWLAERDYDTLFIEDDRASMYYLLAPLRRRHLCVIEEGLGTYMQDGHFPLRTPKGLKWHLASRLTGCATSFGGGRATDFVLVHDLPLYARIRRRNRAVALPFPGLMHELAHMREDWFAAIDAARLEVPPGARRLAFVMGSWNMSRRSTLGLVGEGYDRIYFKAHPHDNSRSADLAVHELAQSYIPAEAIVMYLQERCQELTVFHYASSTAFYCRHGFPNVYFVNLDRSYDRATLALIEGRPPPQPAATEASAAGTPGLPASSSP